MMYTNKLGRESVRFKRRKRSEYGPERTRIQGSTQCSALSSEREGSAEHHAPRALHTPFPFSRTSTVTTKSQFRTFSGR